MYVGKDAFKAETGECVFLPKPTPHAFVIRSPRFRMLALFVPGGLEEAFRGSSEPAGGLDLSTGAPTYSTADVKETARRLGQYGVRLLTPDEIADQLPLYAKPLPRNGGRGTPMAIVDCCCAGRQPDSTPA